MTGEKKSGWLYVALLILIALFFAALFFFVTSARELHSEGLLRRPPRHGMRDDRSQPRDVSAPMMIDAHATTTLVQ